MIEARGLTKRYGATVAVDGLSFDVRPGTVTGFLGPNVADDGIGGADPVGGSGLTGLAQRVRTVDGRLDIASPPGGPTRITVELPLRT